MSSPFPPPLTSLTSPTSPRLPHFPPLHLWTPPYWIGASAGLGARHLPFLRLDLRLVASRLALHPGRYDGRAMSSCVACSETSQTSGAYAIEAGTRRCDREEKLTVSSYSMKILFGKSPHHGSPPRFRQVVLRYTCHCSCRMTARLSGYRALDVRPQSPHFT